MASGIDSKSVRWILVADASRARIFTEQAGIWELVHALEHEESRMRSRDLMADANGRKPAGLSRGTGNGDHAVSNAYGRPGAEPNTDPKDVESQKFAREIATYLDRGRNEHAFGRLVVVAPPAFLGLLRSTMGDETQRLIEASLNKDFTHHPAPELKRQVERTLITATSGE
jgi:protein required for attachment to host cells